MGARWSRFGRVGTAATTLALVTACGPQRDAPEPESSWADADWEAFESKSRWALDQRLDTLELGRAMAVLGEAFVGTAYVPKTLDPEGPERLIINFQGLDCVTFVENVLAMSRFVRRPDADALLGDRAAAEDAYEAVLSEIRYRDGHLDGYASRLHYFSDWIADNQARGLVRDLGGDLGGERDDEPVNFMTTHTEAYRQLADAGNVAAVRAAETRLSESERLYIPEDVIERIEEGIQDGDIIAATSTAPGLDIAHTGLALWRDGRLHLLHAPLVGEAVQISEVPLADRIRSISGQDGVMVARPLDRRAETVPPPAGGAR